MDMEGNESESAIVGTEVSHAPHSSAGYDDMDYVDDRGIRIFDRDWTCPNCGDDGAFGDVGSFQLPSELTHGGEKHKIREGEL